MNYNPKVVSFERSAAYVHHRAMKNRRDNNPVDALELMRQAVQQSPENREYKLDLAEMYCEMGCHEQSNRILLDMLAQKDAPAECYYGLALNQLGRNETEAARRALDLYRRHTVDKEYLEDANSLASEMDFYDAMRRPVNRRHWRAAQIAGRGCDALKASEAEKAIRLFRRSLEMNPHHAETRALYAMALRMKGDQDAALEEASRCVEDPDASVRALCISAQIYWLCGEAPLAQELARRIIEMRPAALELRLLIFTLSELNMDHEAAEAVRIALRETPHDKTLLHMRAVSLHRAGVEDGQLASFWARILRINPADTVAQFYHEAALDGRLAEVKPEFVYEVPAMESRRRVLWIAEKLTGGLDAAIEAWRNDAAFREILLWAVGTGNESCGRAAMMIIACARDEESESVMRELLYRGDVPIEVKLHGMFFLRTHGADMEKLMPPDMDVQDGMLPEADDMLVEMPACERQLVRFADEVLSQDYGIHACAALTLMWQAYRSVCKSANDPLVCTQEAAAALVWNYLLSHGKKVSPGRLARQFMCNSRRMVFYARRMAAVLEKYGGFTENEDH